MKNAENSLKKKINNAVSKEGIDQDLLWGAIEKELVQPRRNFLSNLKLFGLFVIGMASILVWYKINSTNNMENRKVTISKNGDSSTVFSNQAKDALAISNIIIDSKLRDQKEQESSFKNNNNLSSILNTDIEIKSAFNSLTTSSAKIRNNKEYIQGNVYYDKRQRGYSSQEQSSEISDNNNTKLNNLTINYESIIGQDIADETSVMTQRDILPINRLTKNIEPLKMPLLLPSLTQELRVVESLTGEDKNGKLLNSKEKKINPWSIVLSTGVNWMFMNIEDKEGKGTFGDLNKDKAGINGSLDVVYKVNDNFTVSSGFNYSHVNQIFDYSNTMRFQQIDSNRLINYDLDLNTGDSINLIYAPQLLNYKSERRVKHHNVFRIISLPISIGTTKTLGRINLGSEVGLNINYLFSQKGKFLDEQLSVVEFDSQRNGSLAIRKLFLGFHIKPFLEYKIDNKISFHVSSIVSYQLLRESDLYQLNQNAFFIRFTGGIKYSF